MQENANDDDIECNKGNIKDNVTNDHAFWSQFSLFFVRIINVSWFFDHHLIKRLS